LKELINHEFITKRRYHHLLALHHCLLSDRMMRSISRILSLEFYTANEQKKYGEHSLIRVSEEGFSRSAWFEENLASQSFLGFMTDVIETGLMKSQQYDLNRFLTIGEKYTRKDACRLLLWDNNEQATMYGYKTKNNTTP